MPSQLKQLLDEKLAAGTPWSTAEAAVELLANGISALTPSLMSCVIDVATDGAILVNGDTHTEIPLRTVVSGVGNPNFTVTPAGRIQVNATGTYMVMLSMSVDVASPAAGCGFIARLRPNGVEAQSAQAFELLVDSSTGIGAEGTSYWNLSAGDYVSAWVYFRGTLTATVEDLFSWDSYGINRITIVRTS